MRSEFAMFTIVALQLEGHGFESSDRRLTSPLDKPFVDATPFLEIVYSVV